MEGVRMSSSALNVLFSAFVSEKDNCIANNLLEQVTANVYPLIEKIVAANLRNLLGNPAHFSQVQDIPDVRQEIITRLLSFFKSSRENAEAAPILELEDYVAKVSYNCCYEYKQRKYPQRFRLKKKLQYLLTTHTSLGIWQDEAREWFCGLSEWGGDLKHWQIQSTQRTGQLLYDQLPAAIQHIPDPTLRRNSAAEQIIELFNWTQQFIHLGDLISIFQKWWNLSDETVQLEDYFLNQPFDALKIDKTPDDGKKLKTLWSEITLLPLSQRKALLLNLRDSVDHELVTLLPVLGIASLGEIAVSLESTPESLAQIWNSLPLNDQQIATEMGIERRQVINLRRTARERLIRRLSV
jgi:hypothetical protein